MNVQETCNIHSSPSFGSLSGVGIEAGNTASSSDLRARFQHFSQALNLTSIKFKLVKEYGWTSERANKTEPQYKAFLFLVGATTQRMLVPTREIDEMWHMHILDTRQYMIDCARHFGEYVHHYPYLGLKDEADEVRAKALFDQTCDLISNTLGINLRDFNLSGCGGGGCGGGCSAGSCSTSSCSSGHGGGHSHTDVPTTPIIPPAATCSTSDTGRTNTETPTRKPAREEQKKNKKDIFNRFRRGLNLAPALGEASWYASVTPELFSKEDFRPDTEAFQSLSGSKSCH